MERERRKKVFKLSKPSTTSEDSESSVHDISFDNSNSPIPESQSENSSEIGSYGSTDTALSTNMETNTQPNVLNEVCPNINSNSDVNTNEQHKNGSSASEVSSLCNDIELLSLLRKWTLDHQCTRLCINDLLKILIDAGHDLPKDARTLLQTPNKITSLPMNNGEYIYFGLWKVIENVFQKYRFSNTVNMYFNIDGASIFKSTSYQLWPILLSLNDMSPVIVALYGGNKKPVMEEFLSEFIVELTDLSSSPKTIGDDQYSFCIKSFICNAPARSMLKGIIQHTGYYSCERCIVKGSYVNNRIVFPSANNLLMRKDSDFRQNVYARKDSNGKCHQVSHSVFLPLPIDMIKDVSLDYMHLVCLGVMRRILQFLKGYFVHVFNGRLSNFQINSISNKLISIRGFLPLEFNRQSRSLSELDRWKATEFRSFLLYTGFVILKGDVSDQCFKHFVSLSVVIRFLCESDPEVRRNDIENARELLVYFVGNSKAIYGSTFNVYNVHNLLHLPDDVGYFNSSLDEISAFCFENYLHTLKKLVRSSHSPVVQIARRIEELDSVFVEKEVFKTKLKPNLRDGVFETSSGLIFIDSVMENSVKGKYFQKFSLSNFFTMFKFQSKEIGIFLIPPHVKPVLKEVAKTSLKRKCVLLPYKNSHVAIRLLSGVAL